MTRLLQYVTKEIVMAKHKSPAQLNSRVVRINLGTYQVLLGLSQSLKVTMAEALDLAITQKARQERLVTPEIQIPIPLATAYRATSITAYRGIPTATIATNGNKAVAFRIKTKGVRRE